MREKQKYAREKAETCKDFVNFAAQSAAKLGGASAIGASSIAFGLHELYQRKALRNSSHDNR